MAVFGHSGSQAPQLMHSAVIIVDMDRLPRSGRNYTGGRPRMTTKEDGQGRAPRSGPARRPASAAPRSARPRNSSLTGGAGAAATVGRPRAPPSRTAGAGGERGSGGTPERPGRPA